jgi:4-hydroxy-tetrahydrodipicolinate synthase
MPDFGTVLTAVVTPFDDQGAVDEAAFVRILEHLAANGSDGAVVTGTTGEASTLSDEEHLAVVELAAKERPDNFTIIAGTGSNDTHHATELTRRASEFEIDGILSVTPYYNRPPRRGIIRHFEEVAKSTDLPILVYNIPVRTGTDMPNDLLEELAEIDNIVGVKQSNDDNLAPAMTTSSQRLSTSAAAAEFSRPATWSALTSSAWPKSRRTATIFTRR